MFEDLYDAISRLWSDKWPIADGEVSEVILDNNSDTIRLAIAYEFSVGSDGPYTGESFWRPLFPSMKRMQNAKRKFHRRQRVTVRYRSDDPSVNRLDGRVWQDL